MRTALPMRMRIAPKSAALSSAVRKPCNVQFSQSMRHIGRNMLMQSRNGVAPRAVSWALGHRVEAVVNPARVRDRAVHSRARDFRDSRSLMYNASLRTAILRSFGRHFSAAAEKKAEEEEKKEEEMAEEDSEVDSDDYDTETETEGEEIGEEEEEQEFIEKVLPFLKAVGLTLATGTVGFLLWHTPPFAGTLKVETLRPGDQTYFISKGDPVGISYRNITDDPLCDPPLPDGVADWAFPAGEGYIPKGLDSILEGMCLGQTVKVTVPHTYSYIPKSPELLKEKKWKKEVFYLSIESIGHRKFPGWRYAPYAPDIEAQNKILRAKGLPEIPYDEPGTLLTPYWYKRNTPKVNKEVYYKIDGDQAPDQPVIVRANWPPRFDAEMHVKDPVDGMTEHERKKHMERELANRGGALNARDQYGHFPDRTPPTGAKDPVVHPEGWSQWNSFREKIEKETAPWTEDELETIRLNLHPLRQGLKRKYDEAPKKGWNRGVPQMSWSRTNEPPPGVGL